MKYDMVASHKQRVNKMQTTDFRGYDLGAIIAEQPNLVCARDAEGNTIVTVAGVAHNCHPLQKGYYDENNNIVTTPPCYPIRFNI